jgi:hypothetical protein
LQFYKILNRQGFAAKPPISQITFVIISILQAEINTRYYKQKIRKGMEVGACDLVLLQDSNNKTRDHLQVCYRLQAENIQYYKQFLVYQVSTKQESNLSFTSKRHIVNIFV